MVMLLLEHPLTMMLVVIVVVLMFFTQTGMRNQLLETNQDGIVILILM